VIQTSFQVKLFWAVTLCSVAVWYHHFRDLRRQHGSVKLWYPTTILQGVTAQKYWSSIFIAVKTWNLPVNLFFVSRSVWGNSATFYMSRDISAYREQMLIFYSSNNKANNKLLPFGHGNIAFEFW